MYVYDSDGAIVSLKDVASIWIRTGSEYDEFDASVWARENGTGNEYSSPPEYILHQGTMAECRDYMGQMAALLKPVAFDVLSTKRGEAA